MANGNFGLMLQRKTPNWAFFSRRRMPT